MIHYNEQLVRHCILPLTLLLTFQIWPQEGQFSMIKDTDRSDRSRDKYERYIAERTGYL